MSNFLLKHVTFEQPGCNLWGLPHPQAFLLADGTVRRGACCVRKKSSSLHGAGPLGRFADIPPLSWPTVP